MNIKLKYGNDLVSSFYVPESKSDNFIVNLVDRWTYQSFKQWKNYIILTTTKGEVGFVFAGEIYKLEFNHQEKDQVVFNVIY